ncbi:MAG: hypothetical protein ACI32B_02430 [Erysipelotrichaceae bacterium]
MKRKYSVLAIACISVIVLFLVFYLNSHPGFSGSSVKNADVYIMDIERMNGTDLYSMEFKDGDEVSVDFETEKGEMYLKITGSDGKAVYEGNGKGVSLFIINIREKGVYSINLEAKKARGYVNIHLKK